MSVFFYIPSAIASPEAEIMLSKAQAAIDQGERVCIATCRGSVGYACSLNIFGQRSICVACRSKTQSAIANLTGAYTHVLTPILSNYDFSEQMLERSVWTRSDVKNFYYKDVDVGQAAYSSYLGLSRDHRLEGFLAHDSIRKLIRTSLVILEWFSTIVASRDVSQLYLYNGRQNQYRPVLRIAQNIGIYFEILEFSGQTSDCVYVFKRELPQDLVQLSEMIEQCWEKRNSFKDKVISYYYNYKFSGGAVNDRVSYTADQDIGLLPSTWNSNNHNIVIFNSSEDEFAALGGDYDNTLYSSQTHAVEEMAKAVLHDPDIVLWVRMHPNLKNVKWSYVEELLSLGSRFQNVHIIDANSPISSYAVMQAADKVVSFGSTIGIEAAYWGKPSILLGRCIYELLGSVYVPKSHFSLVDLVINKNLKPQPIEGCKKVALFWTIGGESIEYFTGNRMIGFKFNGLSLEFGLISKFYYGFGKAYQKIFLLKILNFHVARFLKKVRIY